MSLSADEIITQRSIRRKLGFWRIATLVMLGIAVLAILAWAGMFSIKGNKNSQHIAKVNISGVIMSDPQMMKLLNELGEADQVKAVIVDISSPGGSTVGGEELYNAMRKLSALKPVATSVGAMAASAGYMIAIGTDHIVARRTSIVGSIGVLFQYADVSVLMNKIGVNVQAIKSAPLKAEPSPFHPASEAAKQMIKSAIDDTFDWFKGLVVERRSLSIARVNQLSDGSVFTGAQALENGLIDAIGNQDTIVEWLETERAIPADLKVLEWKPVRKRNIGWGSSSVYQWFVDWFGIPAEPSPYQMMRDVLTREFVQEGLVSQMKTYNIRGK